MKIGDIVRSAIDVSPVQFLHECVRNAKRISRAKSIPAHTRVEFETIQMTPDDLLYWSREFGQPRSRRPKYVGVIVWIPFETYESATSVAASDPHAASTGGNDVAKR